MRKRFLAAIMAVVMMLSLFAGCKTVTTGGTEDEVIESVITSTKPKSTSSTTSSKVASSSKKKTTTTTVVSKVKNSTVTQTDATSSVFVPNLTQRTIMPEGWVLSYFVQSAEISGSSSGDPDEKPPEIGTAAPADVAPAAEIANAAATVLDWLLGKTDHSDNTSSENHIWNGDRIYDTLVDKDNNWNPSGWITLWGYGSFLEATGAACQYDPTAYQADYEKALTNLKYYVVSDMDRIKGGNGTYMTAIEDSKGELASGSYLSLSCYPNNAANQVFYDDDVWIAKEYLHAYHVLGDQKYKTLSDRMIRYIYDTGWEDTYKGGGIWWMDQFNLSGEAQQKNSCINCPAVDLLTDFYLETGDQYYLDAATKTYAWAKSQLMADNYIMYDKWITNDAGVIELDSGQLTYNTGEMLSAAVGLYQCTGDADYLDDAKNIAAAAANKWLSRTKYKGNWTVLWREGNPWFSSYLVEGYLNLYNVDPTDPELSQYMKMVRSSMFLAYSNRTYTNGQEWIHPDWHSSTATITASQKSVMNQSASVRVLFMTSSWVDAYEGNAEKGIAPLSTVPGFKVN